MLIAAAVIGAGALLAFLWMSKEEEDSGADAKAQLQARLAGGKARAFDHGMHAGKVEILRKRLQSRPCDRRLTRELGDVLNRAGDHHGAIELSDAFLADCGPWPRLLWISFHAHKELGQWDRAIEISTALIESKPMDADYWWWRGQAHELSGRRPEAIADYMQSMANKPTNIAFNLADLVDGTTQACDGAFALQHYIARWPDEDLSLAARRRTEVWLKNDCDRRAGTGHAEIEFQAGAPIIRSDARINGTSVSTIVNDATGLVLLSRKLAGELGVKVADSARVTTYIAGEMLSARPVYLDSIEVGDARATHIVGAVVEELPGGADAVLGLSFLWRFAVEIDEESILLSPLPGG